MGRRNDALSDKQERFCQEFVIDLNATQAAIRAGYSKKTAEQQGSRLLSNVKVAEKIDALKLARTQRTEITADFVLREILKLATVDISKAYDQKGDLLPLHEIPPEVRAAIAGVDVFTEVQYGPGRTEVNEDGESEKVKEVVGRTKKLKLYDKAKALELLGKHLKLFTDKVDIGGKITLADLVEASQAEGKKTKGD